MGDSARKLATYEDLFARPEGERHEIVEGRIVVLPPPMPGHLNVQGAIRRFVGGPFHDDDGFGGPGGWWIFAEADVRFGKHRVLRPDLSGWRRERLTDPNVRPIDVVPDWVCEVLSPSNAAHDRVTKRRLYAEAGVRHYWMADPDARVLEALELQGDRWLELGSYGDDETARIAPFDAVELAIGRLFLPRPPAPPDDEADAR